ncbi:MAG: hypothetical protein B2I17_00600 [Thermoplasmatales archaeon B_DKE]|nr:MAG: hypothetical protein B2I17_00600 [Thermoplasmatales archaeon B_DKE]QRF75639.1 Endoribonuclease Nob1 [Thermoplasmatales archaeon]
MENSGSSGVEPAVSYVVDTSAIISRKLDLLNTSLIFPSSVLGEIRKGRLRRILDALSPEIRIYDPSAGSRNEVASVSKKSGDISVLSETDIDVIATARDLNATIITDDYAIQNVAEFMGIPFTGSDLNRIANKITWKFRCTGCGKFYSFDTGTCRICGHSLKRIAVRKTGKK